MTVDSDAQRYSSSAARRFWRVRWNEGLGVTAREREVQPAVAPRERKERRCCAENRCAAPRTEAAPGNSGSPARRSRELGRRRVSVHAFAERTPRATTARGHARVLRCWKLRGRRGRKASDRGRQDHERRTRFTRTAAGATSSSRCPPRHLTGRLRLRPRERQTTRDRRWK